MNTLFFDTETTGTINFKADEYDPCQPNLVQLGAVLLDVKDSGYKELARTCLLMEPNLFDSIPERATEVHGITVEDCKNGGISPYTALKMFDELLANTERVVCHNVKFDTQIMRIASRRLGNNLPEFPGDCFCTMEAYTPLLKLPGRYGYKWPQLVELTEHCFPGKTFNFHNALADVEATIAVYFALPEKLRQWQ